jgi:hypothetical protein
MIFVELGELPSKAEKMSWDAGRILKEAVNGHEFGPIRKKPSYKFSTVYQTTPPAGLLVA